MKWGEEGVGKISLKELMFKHMPDSESDLLQRRTWEKFGDPHSTTFTRSIKWSMIEEVGKIYIIYYQLGI